MMPKAKRDLASKSEVALQQKANNLYAEAVKKAGTLNQCFVDLGKIASDLRRDSLWKHVTGAKGRPRFRQWTEVLEAVLGRMARKRAYDVLGCFELTQGDNPIPASEVRRMGISRAAQVARLEPTDRTSDIRKAAVTKSVLEVRNQVQQKLNAKLLPTEQKPMLKLLAINLPEQYVQEFEEDMEVGIYMGGIRDGDTTQTMRHKVFHAMLIAFREYWAEELAEALKCMKAEAGVDDSPAAEAQGWQDLPDEEEFADIPEPPEHQQSLLPGVPRS
jgi:hypothetical protein